MKVVITTTAQYGVVGYAGTLLNARFQRGWGGLLTLLALASSGALWRWRGSTHALRRSLWMLLAFLASFGLLSGCGSKTPAAKAVYTTPGSYAYTVTATDGFLTHSATYNLTVTSK